MDNILKMLLGVLSVAGVIALVIPETNPVPNNSTQTHEEPPPPEQSFSPSVPQQQFSSDFDAEPVSDFQIGAPAIDGKPMQPEFGLPFGASPDMNSSSGDSAQSAQGAYIPPPYAVAGLAPQPDNAEQIPTVADQGQ